VIFEFRRNTREKQRGRETLAVTRGYKGAEKRVPGAAFSINKGGD